MNRRRLNDVYKYPLPVAVRPFPPVIPHNPLSLIWLIWEFIYPTQPDRVVVTGKLDNATKYVKVEGEQAMQVLWSMGFFGKGTLSRSEPTWYTRTATKLGLIEATLTSEDITRQRREERKKFKQERASAEEAELQRIRKLERGEQELEREIENEVEKVDPRAADKSEIGATSESTMKSDSSDLLEELGDLVLEDGKLKCLEYLQLSPTEAIFLSYGLGALQVYNDSCLLSAVDLFKQVLSANPSLVYEYVAYHHYRSLGWCARSGIKFGTDLILYRRGPPFSHAEFAVVVLPVESASEKQQWWWTTSIGRVVGGVKKTLVFCHVDGPDPGSLDLNSIIDTEDITLLLKSFHVREVVYRRWIPTRNRD